MFALLKAKRASVLRVFFAGWFVVVLVPSVYQLAEHTLGLPKPIPGKLEARMLASHSTSPGWAVLHVLFAECGCSDRIADRLAMRPPLPGATERVIVVGDADPERVARLRERGLHVDVMTASALSEDYGVEAAPLLVVADPTGRVRYVGGYTEQKRGPVLRDAAIVASLEQGKEVDPLPVLGCAVSRSLQHQIDPLGLKY